MSYSGSAQARSARIALGKSLAALQDAPRIPDEVMAVASNIAQSVGALFEAERASTEPDGRAAVRAALAGISQTLTLLVDVRADHPPIQLATVTLAQVMSQLYPLTTVTLTADPATRAPTEAVPPARAQPPAPAPQPAPVRAPAPAPAPVAPVAPNPATPAAPTPSGPRTLLEVNLGANTRSNFFVGFSSEVSEGGVFLATFELLPARTSVRLLVTLPGDFHFEVDAWVRFVTEPGDLSSGGQPGLGLQFERLSPEARALILRFIRKRPPLFFDE